MRTLSRRRLTGLLVVAGSALALYAALAGGVPSIQSGSAFRHVKAEFASTNELRGGDPVRVDGVEVGAVEEIELVRGGRAAIVTMSIEHPGVDIRRNARADLRWRTALGGNPYIDLDPGTTAAPALGDAVLPAGQTASQVEVDQVMSPLGGSTPEAIRNSLRQLSRGLDDAPAVGRTIDALSPSLTTVDRGVGALRGARDDDLGELVAGMSRTVRAIDRGGERLDRLVAGGAATFETLSANRSALGQSLDLSPAALDSARETMRRLRPTLDRLDPLAARLTDAVEPLAPALGRATPTLEEARVLLRDARPLLRELPEGLDALAAASRQGAPLMAALEPVLDRMEDPLLPFLERRDEDNGLRNYEAIGPTFAAADSAAGEFDGGGYVLHFPSLGDERSALSSPCQPYLTDPSADEKLRCDALAAVLEEVFGPPEAAR